MPYTLKRLKKAKIPSFSQLYLPIDKAKIGMRLLEARGDRPLKMTFDDQLKALIIDGTKYWVATSRYDLSAEQIALIYKLRWDIEKFFAWWKRHLKVYHLIARSEYGLMVQILVGLITYLLLAIYCHEQHNEKVSIKRVRELRIKIQNEIRIASSGIVGSNFENHGISNCYAKT